MLLLLLVAAGCDPGLNHQMTHEKKVEMSLATLEARSAEAEAKLAAIEARLARIEGKLPPVGKPDDARRDAASDAGAGGEPKPGR